MKIYKSRGSGSGTGRKSGSYGGVVMQEYNFESDHSNLILKEIKNEIKKLMLFKKMQEMRNFRIIHDFQEAKFYAFEKDDYEGIAGATWNDIREHQFSEAMSFLYSMPDYRERAKRIRSITIPEVDEIQYTDEALQIEEEIYTDLLLFIRYKMIGGYKKEFFEKMFEIYKLGGWPCGWNGKYPEGNFIVYFPA